MAGESLKAPEAKEATEKSKKLLWRKILAVAELVVGAGIFIAGAGSIVLTPLSFHLLEVFVATAGAVLLADGVNKVGKTA